MEVAAGVAAAATDVSVAALRDAAVRRCERHGLPVEPRVADEVLHAWVEGAGVELVPVAAIVGGMIGASTHAAVVMSQQPPRPRACELRAAQAKR